MADQPVGVGGPVTERFASVPGAEVEWVRKEGSTEHGATEAGRRQRFGHRSFPDTYEHDHFRLRNEERNR